MSSGSLPSGSGRARPPASSTVTGVRWLPAGGEASAFAPAQRSRAAAARLISVSIPAPMSVRFLQIEPTTRCNFTCGFCAGRAMAQTDLPFERFAETLDSFPAVEHIELQGEGESLMHPQ